MATVTSFPNAPDLSADDYLVLGLATCYYKEDGEVHEVKIVEPIPSAALEALIKGIPTSYQFACATRLGDVIGEETLQMLEAFPEEARFGDEFIPRAFAAARTYKRRPEAMSHIPLGTTYDNLKYSIERKRVLNASRIVTKEDNVKQHAYTHKVL